MPSNKIASYHRHLSRLRISVKIPFNKMKEAFFLKIKIWYYQIFPILFWKFCFFFAKKAWELKWERHFWEMKSLETHSTAKSPPLENNKRDTELDIQLQIRYRKQLLQNKKKHYHFQNSKQSLHLDEMDWIIDWQIVNYNGPLDKLTNEISTMGYLKTFGKVTRRQNKIRGKLEVFHVRTIIHAIGTLDVRGKLKTVAIIVSLRSKNAIWTWPRLIK